MQDVGCLVLYADIRFYLSLKYLLDLKHSPLKYSLSNTPTLQLFLGVPLVPSLRRSLRSRLRLVAQVALSAHTLHANAKSIACCGVTATIAHAEASGDFTKSNRKIFKNITHTSSKQLPPASNIHHSSSNIHHPTSITQHKLSTIL